MTEATIIRGYLGWKNLADQSDGQLATYGPGGRWGSKTEGVRGNGHHLADAVESEGYGEGTRLIVVALPRFTDVDAVEATITAALEADPPTDTRDR